MAQSAMVRQLVVHPPLARIKIRKKGEIWYATVTLDLPTGPLSVSFCISEKAIAAGAKFLHAQALLTREAAAKMSASSGADFGSTVKGFVSKVRAFAYNDAIRRQRTDVLTAMQALANAKFPTQIMDARKKLAGMIGNKLQGSDIPIDYLNVRLAAVQLAKRVLGPSAASILAMMPVTSGEPSQQYSFKVVSGEAQRIAATLRKSPRIAARAGIPVVPVYAHNAAWHDKWLTVLRNYGKDPRATKMLNIVRHHAEQGIPKYVELWQRLAAFGMQIQAAAKNPPRIHITPSPQSTGPALDPIRRVSSGDIGPRADGYGPGYGVAGYTPGLTPFQAAIAALNRNNAARAALGPL